MKKYIATFVAGFLAAAIQVLPAGKALGCCLILPVASFAALMLDQKATGNYDKIMPSKALIFGLLTGVISAVFLTFFELLITFVTHYNDYIAMLETNSLDQSLSMLDLNPELKEEVARLFYEMGDDIKQNGFSLLYTFSIFTQNFIIDPLFGLIGGLIGAQILNYKNSHRE